MTNKPLPDDTEPPTTVKWGEKPEHIDYELTFDLKDGKKISPVEFVLAFDSELVNIDRTIVNIGRDKSNDIVIRDNHGNISRKHARLYVEEKTYFLQDVGSANGTYVNKQPVIRSTGVARLDSGDLVCFGGGDFPGEFEPGWIGRKKNLAVEHRCAINQISCVL